MLTRSKARSTTSPPPLDGCSSRSASTSRKARIAGRLAQDGLANMPTIIPIR
jgi:hypothetical protein